MLKILLEVIFSSAVLFCFSAPLGAEEQKAISIGYGTLSAQGGSAQLMDVMYEKELNKQYTFTIMLGKLSYKTSDEGGSWSETDEAQGTGLIAGLRIYPMGNGLDGFYWGPIIGIIPMERTYTYTTDFAFLNQNQTSKIQVTVFGLSVGGKFDLSEEFFIEPNLTIENASSDEPGAETVQALLLGFSVGKKF